MKPLAVVAVVVVSYLALSFYLRDKARKPGTIRARSGTGAPSTYEQARAARTLLPAAGSAAGSYFANGGMAGGATLPVATPAQLALATCSFGPSFLANSRPCGAVRRSVIGAEDAVARHVPGGQAAIAAQTTAIAAASHVVVAAGEATGNAVAAVAGGIGSGANAIGGAIGSAAGAVGSAAGSAYHAVTGWL